MHSSAKQDQDENQTARRPRPGLVLTVVSIGAGIVALDGTVVAVANPDIAASLQPTMGQLQWVTNSYLLMIAATLVIFGRAADRFSKRWFWLTGVALFTLSSLLIAVSPTVEWVIAWRAVQGLAGALIMPAGVGLLRAGFEGPALSKAIAVWSGTTGLAAAAGPVIAGVLVQAFGWHAVFLINVPVGILVVILGLCHLKDSPPEQKQSERLDILGAILLAGAMVCLVWGVLQAEHGTFGPSAWGWIACAVVLSSTFVWWQRHASAPLLDLAVFRNRTVIAASLLVVVAFFVLYGTIFFLTLYMQRIQGVSAFEAGVGVLPMTAALAIASTATGRIVARFGPKPPLLVGIIAAGSASVGLSLLTVNSTYHELWPWLILMGGGIGSISVASTDALVGSVPASLSSVAGGVQQTSSQLGGVIGTAGLTMMVAAGVESSFRDRLVTAEITDPSVIDRAMEETDRVSQGEVPNISGTSPETIESLTMAAQTTFVDSMTTAMTISWVLAAAGIVLALLFKNPGDARSDKPIVTTH